jgi:hypothetical protein
MILENYGRRDYIGSARDRKKNVMAHDIDNVWRNVKTNKPVALTEEKHARLVCKLPAIIEMSDAIEDNNFLMDAVKGYSFIEIYCPIAKQIYSEQTISNTGHGTIMLTNSEDYVNKFGVNCLKHTDGILSMNDYICYCILPCNDNAKLLFNTTIERDRLICSSKRYWKFRNFICGVNNDLPNEPDVIHPVFQKLCNDLIVRI